MLLMKDKIHSITDIDDLFKEAAETERKLPASMRHQKMASWPDYVTEWSGYGYSSEGVTRLKATPEQITRLDLAVEIGLHKLDTEDRRLIWAVSHSAAFRERGPKWTKLAKILGLHDPRIVKRRYKDALVNLYYRL